MVMMSMLCIIEHMHLREYMLYLVNMSIFVVKIAYYVDVVYLRYFTELKQIHEYNYTGRLFGLDVL